MLMTVAVLICSQVKWCTGQFPQLSTVQSAASGTKILTPSLVCVIDQSTENKALVKYIYSKFLCEHLKLSSVKSYTNY